MSKGKTTKCLKGINYGSINFESKALGFVHNDLVIMKVPYEDITASHSINKNEIFFELKNDDKENDQGLCEFRMIVEENEAEDINDKILEKIGLKQSENEHLLTIFEDLKFTQPRGKHSVSFFEKKIKFHGGTFNYKVEFANLGKIYLLPQPKKDLLSLVLTFKQPIKQGSTRYSFFTIEFHKEDKTSIKLDLSNEDFKEKYSHSLESEYEGRTYEIFTKLFKSLANINIIIPGNFKSYDGEACIKCALKSTDGNLYLLQNSLLFLPKANIYFKNDDIKQVEFLRLGENPMIKTFDIHIQRKDNTFSATFSGIDKREYEILEKYFQSKNVITTVTKEDFGEDSDEYEDSRKSSKSKKDFVPENDDDDDDDDESFVVDENSEQD